MTKLRLVLVTVVLFCIVAWLVHLRGLVLQQKYALGELLRFQEKHLALQAELKSKWERLSDPAILQQRAEKELKMQPPDAKQILR